MLKAARIFQLFKLSYVLQVLVNTLKASSSELCLLLVIMGFVMVVFASFVYFLERHEFESDFKSVPESMWWAVITMTTVSRLVIEFRHISCLILASAKRANVLIHPIVKELASIGL